MFSSLRAPATLGDALALNAFYMLVNFGPVVLHHIMITQI